MLSEYGMISNESQVGHLFSSFWFESQFVGAGWLSSFFAPALGVNTSNIHHNSQKMPKLIKFTLASVDFWQGDGDSKRQ